MIGAFASSFLAVFLAELPDKTMVATLVLTARFRRPFAVWCGVALAFAVSSGLATLAGTALSRLPDRVVSAATAVLFAIGAVMLWRQRNERHDLDPVVGATRSFRSVAAVAFGTVIVAEVGDLTQLTIAGLAARSSFRLAVFAGGTVALFAVAALAAAGGRTIERRLPVRTLHTGAAVVFAALAVWSAIAALAG